MGKTVGFKMHVNDQLDPSSKKKVSGGEKKNKKQKNPMVACELQLSSCLLIICFVC